jgi:hypothetical protein
MARKDIETKLRLAIKEALLKVTKVNSPAVYGFFHKDNGHINIEAYNRLENMIIHKVIATQISIEASIPQIENELNLM